MSDDYHLNIKLINYYKLQVSNNVLRLKSAAETDSANVKNCDLGIMDARRLLFPIKLEVSSLITDEFEEVLISFKFQFD